jgi:hypothetical protein
MANIFCSLFHQLDDGFSAKVPFSSERFSKHADCAAIAVGLPVARQTPHIIQSFYWTNPGVRNYRTGLFRNTRIRKGIKPEQGQPTFLHAWGGLRYEVSQRQIGLKVV